MYYLHLYLDHLLLGFRAEFGDYWLSGASTLPRSWLSGTGIHPPPPQPHAFLLLPHPHPSASSEANFRHFLLYFCSKFLIHLYQTKRHSCMLGDSARCWRHENSTCCIAGAPMPLFNNNGIQEKKCHFKCNVSNCTQNAWLAKTWRNKWDQITFLCLGQIKKKLNENLLCRHQGPKFPSLLWRSYINKRSCISTWKV